MECGSSFSRSWEAHLDAHGHREDLIGRALFFCRGIPCALTALSRLPRSQSICHSETECCWVLAQACLLSGRVCQRFAS